MEAKVKRARPKLPALKESDSSALVKHGAPVVSVKSRKSISSKTTKTVSFSKKDTSGGKRLTKGCSSLMYACQRGLTDQIVKELRTKVNIYINFMLIMLIAGV